MLMYLDHPDHFVRAAACEVLGALRDTRATLPLTARLDDNHLMVRRGAAFALAELGDARAADAVLRRWQDHPDEDINVMAGLSVGMKALGIAYDRRWLFSSRGQPKVKAQSEHSEVPTAPVPESAGSETTSRYDLLYALTTAARYVQSFVCDGKVQATNKEQELQSLRRLLDSHWKIGRSNGRVHRKQLRDLIWGVHRIEECPPFRTTLLTTEEQLQTRATLRHLKEISTILETNDDFRPSIERLREHLSEVVQFLDHVRWGLDFE